MIRRPPRSTLDRSSAASDVYKRQGSMYGRRNPAAFFKALEKLHYRKEIDITKIRLRFIGRFGDEVLEMFKSTDIRNCIEVIGYMQHNELTKQLLLSDALLLIVDESDDSNEIVPGKVYEYIGSGKGVLAIAPEKSAIADLIKETNSGYVAHQSNLDGIADSFLIFYNAHQNGCLLYTSDAADERYSVDLGGRRIIKKQTKKKKKKTEKSIQ